MDDRTFFERHDVQTFFQTSVAAIEGDERVRTVTLTDGRRIEADAVLVGIGVGPEVELGEAAGLTVDDGIVVDDPLRTSSPEIFAAVGVARFPSIEGPRIRVEHFDNADSSGSVAGANMTGADAAYRHVPFFLSDVFELSFEFLGDPAPDAKTVEGMIESGSFIVEYREGGRLRGALLAQRTAEERDVYRDGLGNVKTTGGVVGPQTSLGELAHLCHASP